LAQRETAIPGVKKIRREIKRKLGLRTERPAFTGKYYERARRLLLDTVDILNEAALPYTLDAGTLLGLVRDSDLIPWDNDVDLMLPASHVAQLRRLYPKFLLHGWKMSRTYRMPFATEAWRVGDPRVIKLRNLNPWLFGPGSTLLDITIIYPHDGAYWWEMAKKVCQTSEAFFNHHETIEYGGRIIRVPHNYQAYLEQLYGEWQIPDKAFHHDQFGTIIRQND
jgi:hypothetical protein